MARTKKLSDSELLRVAYDVGSREGFDSFTLKQVARSADVSPAAMIKRFKSKARMVSLARHHRWESTLSQFDARSTSSLRGLAGVRHLVSLIAKNVESKHLSQHARAFGAEERDPRARMRVGEYFAATRAVLARLLSEAVTDGELADSIDTTKLAFTLEALIQGSIFQFAFLREHDVEAHMHAHVQTFLQSFATVAKQTA